MLTELINLDKQLFLFFNGLNNGVFDFLMWHISGKLIWIPLYIIILYAIIRTFGKRSIIIIVAIVLTIVATDQISVLIKNSVQRLRPTHNPEFEGLVHFLNDYRGGNFGFVSSHAANCFGLATFISLLFQRKWVIIAITVWAITVSYSRIYLGVHYPADLVAGGLLGIVLALIFYQIKKIKNCHFDNS